MLDPKYYHTEGRPPFINEPLTIEQWRSYIADYPFPYEPAGLVLHHTYVPNEAQWRGLATMRSMQRYYAGKGWTAGPHIYVGPDAIWLASPMNREGIHAGKGNRLKINGVYRYTIGLEMVGFFDKVKPAGNVWLHAREVMAGLVRRYGWDLTQKITFHRDYTNQKSCPGWAVTKDWVFSELRAYLAGTQQPTRKTWYVTVTATDGLNIRQGAAIKYDIVDELPYGARVLVRGVKNEGEGDWLHLDDERGFIKAKYTIKS